MTEPKPVQVDPDGTKWWLFAFSYDWDGKEYSFSIAARTAEEAVARVKRLPLARYDGQIDGYPTPLLRGGFLVPLVVMYRNWWARR